MTQRAIRDREITGVYLSGSLRKAWDYLWIDKPTHIRYGKTIFGIRNEAGGEELWRIVVNEDGLRGLRFDKIEYGPFTPLPLRTAAMARLKQLQRSQS